MLNILEGRGDKDSELYFVLGKSHALMGDNANAEKYFRLALDYYPSSAHYVYEIASYYASRGKDDEAMQYIRSFDPYIEKHRGPHNPRGIFVYKIRDLEADLQCKNGNSMEAVNIAQKNLQDAKNNIYVITSAKSRNFIARDQFVEYLKQKADLYGSNVAN